MGKGSFFMSEWNGLAKVIPTHPARRDGKREFLYAPLSGLYLTVQENLREVHNFILVLPI
jgi:hypothetical protein